MIFVRDAISVHVAVTMSIIWESRIPVKYCKWKTGMIRSEERNVDTTYKSCFKNEGGDIWAGV